jgi:hypothetical protein
MAFSVLVLMFIGWSCGGERPAITPKAGSSPAKATVPNSTWLQAVQTRSMTTVPSTERPRIGIGEEYVKSLEVIKTVADKAFDKEDFALAGKTYDVLRKNYSRFNGFAQTLSFDKAHLNTRLSHCKRSLSTQGFQEYRKGNLGGAIVLWQSLLAIDPDNADIKGAVRTAMLQKKNIQESGGGR